MVLTLDGSFLRPQRGGNKDGKESERKGKREGRREIHIYGIVPAYGGSGSLLTHVSAQVLQSVAHTSESRIDAHAGLFSDLLEALLFPVAKAYDLLLLG